MKIVTPHGPFLKIDLSGVPNNTKTFAHYKWSTFASECVYNTLQVVLFIKILYDVNVAGGWQVCSQVFLGIGLLIGLGMIVAIALYVASELPARKKKIIKMLILSAQLLGERIYFHRFIN